MSPLRKQSAFAEATRNEIALDPPSTALVLIRDLRGGVCQLLTESQPQFAIESPNWKCLRKYDLLTCSGLTTDKHRVSASSTNPPSSEGSSVLNIRYVPHGQLLDIYYPKVQRESMPAVVWIHGGGW
jgi:acetyl esterase/lipase